MQSQSLIRETFLRAKESKKQAYYKLKTLEISDGYLIKKESGIADNRALHEETYFRESLKEALKLHSEKIKEKTNTKTKRKRVYDIVSDIGPDMVKVDPVMHGTFS